MTDRKNPDAERKIAWKHTKDSVHAYARNPCAATEVDVKAAVAEVRHLQEALIGVRMLLFTGKFQQAEHRAKQVLAEAEVLAYEPLIAEALYSLGEAKERLGDYTTAQEQLQQAYWKAATSEHLELMAQASIQLIWVIGYRLSALQEGLFWSLVAKSFLELLEWPANLEIYYHTYLGTVHGSKGDHGKKLHHCQKAAALSRKSLGENHPSLANSLNCIGVVYWRQGDDANALDYYQQALAIEMKTLGKHHPYVARSLWPRIPRPSHRGHRLAHYPACIRGRHSDHRQTRCRHAPTQRPAHTAAKRCILATPRRARP